MPDQAFTQRLRESADHIWKAQYEHPVVVGIGDGSLDPQIFGFWLRQDYLFLIDYCRLFAMAVVLSPDLDAMTAFSRLLHETLTREMELHRSLAAEFGVSLSDLATEQKTPTTQGYTDFLLRTAATGDFAELLGALLPCMWGYSELGQRLANMSTSAHSQYANWIATYAGPEFAELAKWCRDLTDQACAGLPESALLRVEHAFVTSSRYELAFWEMAWRRETIPDEGKKLWAFSRISTMSPDIDP